MKMMKKAVVGKASKFLKSQGKKAVKKAAKKAKKAVRKVKKWVKKLKFWTQLDQSFDPDFLQQELGASSLLGLNSIDPDV